MAEDVWILGITMTKFGKHPDKDVIDLASEAAIGALKDGGVTIKDMGLLAYGNLVGQSMGQMLQKQIGQTGIPVYNVSNACATGATALRTAIMAVKAGECDMGLAVGVEKLAGAGLLAGGSRKSDSAVIDLPLPDSPTSANVSRRSIESESASTARASPVSVSSTVLSPFTESIGAALIRPAPPQARSPPAAARAGRRRRAPHRRTGSPKAR